MAGFKNGIRVVFAEDVQVEDKIVVDGVVCKVARINENYKLNGYVVFDLFCYDNIGYFCYDQSFKVRDSFVEVL